MNTVAIVIGASGLLGSRLLEAYESLGVEAGCLSASLHEGRPPLKALFLLHARKRIIVVNAAGIANVDQCETSADECATANAELPEKMANECKLYDARFVQISTDFVFDSLTPSRVFTEADQPRPPMELGGRRYAISKFNAERHVAKAVEDHLIVRTSWLFDAKRNKTTYPEFILAREAEAISGRAMAETPLVEDRIGAPTHAKDAAMAIAILSLLGSARLGGNRIVHVANTLSKGRGLTAIEYAAMAANMHSRAVDSRRPHPLMQVREPLGTGFRKATRLQMLNEGSWKAARPMNSTIQSRVFQKLTGLQMRPLEEAMAEFVEDMLA